MVYIVLYIEQDKNIMHFSPAPNKPFGEQHLKLKVFE